MVVVYRTETTEDIGAILMSFCWAGLHNIIIVINFR